MSVEKKTGLYFLYNNDEDLNEADPLMSGQDTNTAFALKDDDMVSWCVCEIMSFLSYNLLQESPTSSDPRDFMQSVRVRQGDFRMLKLRTGLTPLQKTAVKLIIDKCSIRGAELRDDSWAAIGISNQNACSQHE